MKSKLFRQTVENVHKLSAKSELLSKTCDGQIQQILLPDLVYDVINTVLVGCHTLVDYLYILLYKF